MAEIIGAIEVVATINTKDYDAAKEKIKRGNEELDTGSKKTSSAFSSAWIGAIAGVAASLTNKFLGAVTSSIDGAIKRIDTLNNSSRTFANMGIDAISSAKAMKALDKSIKGLPTPLDAAVRGMTSLTATYGDINKGQKVFSALNNAILGFGGTSSMVDNAITQLSQLPMDGPLDAQTWNSLRNSGITPVLTAMAKDSGMSVSAMKEAFGKGELSVQDFTDRLLKMDKEGGGGLTSLEKIAKDSTKGIGTGFANMQTSIVRGTASIIEAIGSENIASVLSTIGKGFETTLKYVSSFVNFIKSNSTVFSSLAVGIGVAGTAILLYNTYVKAAAISTAAFSAVSSYLTLVMSLQAQGLGIVRASWLALNIAMKANPIGLIITIVIGLISALIWFATQTETGRKVFSDAFNAMKTAAEVSINSIKWAVSSLWNFITSIFSNLGNFFRGVWNGVVGIFTSVGTVIGDRIGGAFRSVINGVIRGAINIINGFIRSINAVTGVINKVPGVNIGRIGELGVPALASGGIIPATSGGRLALIGEGGQDEAVIPLNRLESMFDLSDTKGSNKDVSIVNNYNIENDTDVEVISRRQAYAMGRY